MTVQDAKAYKKTNVGSSRSFGLVFAGAFALIGLLPMLRGDDTRVWALLLSALFLLTSIAAPSLLKPLNLLWFRFGLVLHAIFSPIVMALIFYVAVVPVGLLMRAFGKDPLRLKRDKSAVTYWISRNPPGPVAGSLRKQF